MPINPPDQALTESELKSLFTDPPVRPERPVPTYMFDEGADQTALPLMRALPAFVTSVQAQNLAGLASDFHVLAHARSLGCTLIVNDKAFKKHHDRLISLGLSHSGIIWLKRGLDPEKLVAFAERMREVSENKGVANLLYDQFIRMK